MPPPRSNVIALLDVQAFFPLLLAFNPVNYGNVDNGFARPNHTGNRLRYGSAIGNDIVEPAFAAVILTNGVSTDESGALSGFQVVIGATKPIHAIVGTPGDVRIGFA